MGNHNISLHDTGDERSTSKTNCRTKNTESYDDEHNEVTCPDDFICPLTLTIMTDPVMDRTGRSFERSAILEWMACGNFTCPLTRRTMHLHDLVTNHSLQFRIQVWKKERKRQKIQQERDEKGDYSSNSCSATDDETEEHDDDEVCEKVNSSALTNAGFINNANNILLHDFYDDDDSMAYALGMIQVGTGIDGENFRRGISDRLQHQQQQGIRLYAVPDIEDGDQVVSALSRSSGSRRSRQPTSTNHVRQPRAGLSQVVASLREGASSIHTGGRRRGLFWNRRGERSEVINHSSNNLP